jgi:hypothetical protein
MEEEKKKKKILSFCFMNRDAYKVRRGERESEREREGGRKKTRKENCGNEQKLKIKNNKSTA